MKAFLISLTLVSLSVTATAQSSEDSVKMVINKMFAGMKNADSAMFMSTFAPDAILQTIGMNKQRQTVVATDKLSEFAGFVAKLKKDSADERITFDMIKIDGALAIAWTPYKFYHNGNFSHCGVNSFQLVKYNGEWKIQYLVDTRRRTNCL